MCYIPRETTDERGKRIVGGYFDQTDREMYHVTPSEALRGKVPPWPTRDIYKDADIFNATSLQHFDLLEDIALNSFSAALTSLGIDSSTIRKDYISKLECSQNSAGYSTRSFGSALRVLKYKKESRNQGILCLDHCDSSVLSLAPVSDVHELEFYIQQEQRWVNVEERFCWQKPQNMTVILFVGRILSRWSAGYFPPMFHRVKRSSINARFSTPFFLRTQLSGEIDAAKFIENSDLSEQGWSVPDCLDVTETFPEWEKRRYRLHEAS
eukprot:TRINITY_DN9747_c0_g1_i1.p1 TRINITY_DN9747_c0_g1~~TRINITY_DN9747_c0_g1_i1.p1  ORF type:complete len:267 (+),score=29.33 TRINITY_DN9747_c0_g1_i1:580-1380(+)